MTRSRSQHSLGSRAEQTGLLLATGAGPLTFQRTLMPRSTSDQAVITGLSFAANHTLVSLLQESLQSAALLLLGAAGRDAVDERRWSRAALAVDAAAIAGGLGVQRALACTTTSGFRAPGRAPAASWSRPPVSAASSSAACRSCWIVEAVRAGRRGSWSCPRQPVSPSAASCSAGGEHGPTNRPAPKVRSRLGKRWR